MSDAGVRIQMKEMSKFQNKCLIDLVMGDNGH